MKARHLAYLAAATLVMVGAAPAQAWDSGVDSMLMKRTHGLLTSYGLGHFKRMIGSKSKSVQPSFNKILKEMSETYRTALFEGANSEFHELKLEQKVVDAYRRRYGIDARAKRVATKGTNEGCDNIHAWWKYANQAYKAGKKKLAYFYLGVILHMVQDMGSPAHAYKIWHQGGVYSVIPTLRDFAPSFDNFEFMGTFNWKIHENKYYRGRPRGFSRDPKKSRPSDYYVVSRSMTRADVGCSPRASKCRRYADRHFFSKTWSGSNDKEKSLLVTRQVNTQLVVAWALNAAANQWRVGTKTRPTTGAKRAPSSKLIGKYVYYKRKGIRYRREIRRHSSGRYYSIVQYTKRGVRWRYACQIPSARAWRKPSRCRNCSKKKGRKQRCGRWKRP